MQLPNHISKHIHRPRHISPYCSLKGEKKKNRRISERIFVDNLKRAEELNADPQNTATFGYNPSFFLSFFISFTLIKKIL
jgi:hypothetical protein